MTIEIVTIFPEFFTGPLEHGILRRAHRFGDGGRRKRERRQDRIGDLLFHGHQAPPVGPPQP